MKTAVLNLLQTSGAFSPFRFAHSHRALVVMYHRFSAGHDLPKLSAATFHRQLEYLAAHYDVVPLSFLVARLAAGRPLPPRTAVVTIDDGYRDAYTVAFPALRQRNLPATVFVVSGFTGGSTWLWTDRVRYLARQVELEPLRAAAGERFKQWNPRTGRGSPADLVAGINDDLKQLEDQAKDDRIAMLAARLGVTLPETPPEEFAAITWDQAREMQREGIEIGSHTVTHPILTKVDAARLRRELADSREHIAAELGQPVDLFCYPNGTFDDSVKTAVGRAGYVAAVTCDAGFNDRRSDPLALRRISTEGDLPRFVQSTSGFEDIKLKARRVASALLPGG
jgi:peptidoglycan/xylan/chitin deacetylase (PgdA/CDA1 family)